ncbi:MAG: hypothetical protein EOR57_21075 [Mesorhizobium sp.]|uniref:hypothetical protein n=1 Tax=Mesorhizobium sp. TaxID=1871066 RepID=UPI000FE62F8B|nr:hypothetical protein [Mesorhizobium sp.]RWL18154.1 MAG: hypothetical protein EOR57_21075 [Mesorhizobium sp.]
MATTTLERPDKFRIGRVFSNSFAVIGRNPGLLVGLAALFSALPALVLNFWNYSNFANINIANPESIAVADPSAILRNSLISMAFGLIYFVLALLFQSSLVRATIEDLNGKRPAIGDCIQIAVRCILPTIGIGLVIFLTMILAMLMMFVAGMLIPIFGALIAFIVLLVPGIMLLLGVSVSVPVLIQERLGVFSSMSRSRALTKGSRWSLFGLLLILFLAAIAIQMAFALVFGFTFAITGSLSTVGLVVGAIGSALVSTVVSTVISVAIAVSYVELRQVKEGTSVDELAEIFS